MVLRGRPIALQWIALLAGSLVLLAGLELIHLSAGLLLGPMFAAIALAAHGGEPKVPQPAYVFAQGVAGCLIARGITPEILVEIVRDWPVFLASIVSVILVSVALGALLARMQVLPGTTAVWGSAPGAATAMTLMSEAFGGDLRLVAFMQFLRVVIVASVASLVARLWVGQGGGGPPALEWFGAVEPLQLATTVGIAAVGSVIGVAANLPAGAMLVPLTAAVVLAGAGLVTITLPRWLLAVCYAVLGWGIGLRFTRDIVAHAARAFLKVAASILALIAGCAGLAYLLHVATGTDMLTAYLATSPGGADTVAIIASGAHVDLPFIMAMQTGRFLLVLFFGPSLAKAVARWVRSST
jgi:membrane AbrB-like protein